MNRADFVTRPWRYAAAALALALFLGLIYMPGIDGPFVLDDEENITANPSAAMTELNWDNLVRAASANQSGALGRPLASLSLALNHYLAGTSGHTWGYKLTNLVIHLINSILVYVLARMLTRTPALKHRLPENQQHFVAATAAFLWSVHPIQLTNVLYVVQRMNSLSALFVLAGLLLFVSGREKLSQDPRKAFVLMASGIAGGTLLGLMAKENAVLLPMFALSIEYVLFRREDLNDSRRRLLFACYGLTLAIPFALFAIYLVWHPEFLTQFYADRHYSPIERLLSETRVLWFYFSLIVIPTPERMGLFHDDIPLSTSLLDPPITLIASGAWIVLLALALLRARRYPLTAFAVLWFLSGHILESSVLNLELAFEHRNYIPSFGVLFALSTGFVVWARRHDQFDRIRWALPAAIMLLSMVTWNRAHDWRDILSFADSSVRHHPASIRANDLAARISLTVRNDPVTAVAYTLRALEAAPKEAGLHLDLHLRLAILAREVTTTLAANPSVLNPAIQEILIDGLPENIQANLMNGRVQLNFTGSTTAAVTDLLATQPISVHTVVALEELHRCLIMSPDTCSELHQFAVEWYTVAAKNPRTQKDYRAILNNDAGMLFAQRGEYERALAYMTEAAALLPAHTPYDLRRVEYLIRLGRLTEARDLLDKVTSQGDENLRRPIDQQAVSALRTMLGAQW
jgi:tetratricopeptide (TPR) repeat protein